MRAKVTIAHKKLDGLLRVRILASALCGTPRRGTPPYVLYFFVGLNEDTPLIAPVNLIEDFVVLTLVSKYVRAGNPNLGVSCVGYQKIRSLAEV
jgi:hypothetical protein